MIIQCDENDVKGQARRNSYFFINDCLVISFVSKDFRLCPFFLLQPI